MIIDCDTCEVRGTACGSCVVGVLIDTPEIDRPVPYLPVDLPEHRSRAEPQHRSEPLYLAEPERRALEVLADQGLIPRLRLVQAGRPAHPAAPQGLELDAG
ncbi:MAG: hypothetical protein L0I76_10995 [Pseudonocardia sp.]|nr:hypothetical protein [Pseudonocardia sp.]